MNLRLALLSVILPIAAAGSMPAYAQDQQSAEKNESSTDGSFGSLEDNLRYISLMGTIDGMSATGGVTSVCFPGMTTSMIDEKISEAGKADIAVEDLAPVLASISGECSSESNSNYFVGLIKELPDRFFDLYVVGATFGAVKSGNCSEDKVEDLAQDLTLNVRTGSSDTSTVSAIRKSIERVCN